MKKHRKPNVLFIVADDHRFDAIQSFGNKEVKTPALDLLVKTGVTFRNTYITGGFTEAVCAPSRACINTGNHALHTSDDRKLIHGSDLMTINPDLSLLPETLYQSGYHTFFTGKWHNDKESFKKSFCDGTKIFFGGMSDHKKVPVYEFDSTGKYPEENQFIGGKFSTDLFADAAIDFIQEYRKEKPFFLYLAFTSPHDPRNAPSKYANLYDPEKVPLPMNFMEEHPFDNGEMEVRDEKLVEHPRSPEVIRSNIADYYGMISHMDERIGDIVGALERTGQLNNTIIVYTSDHGIALGQHGLMGKQNLYEHSVRIPLIMSGSHLSRVRGKQFEQLACQFDIFPTLCELIGIPVPETVEGQSLLPLIKDEKKCIHESVFTVYKDIQRMVCDGEWKYIRYYQSEDKQTGSDQIQLFHIKKDPWEMNDLSDNPNFTYKVEHLAETLSLWQQHTDDPLAYKPVIPAEYNTLNNLGLGGMRNLAQHLKGK